LSTLWARRAIRDLEEGCSRLHAFRGSRQERAAAGLDERVKTEIVRLGTTYGLMSRHTSFVAIEKRETSVQGEIQLRKIPVAISAGWHGTVAMPRYFFGAMGAMGAPADGAVLARRMPVPTTADSPSRVAELFLPWRHPLGNAGSPHPPRPPTVVGPLRRLSRRRSAFRDGGWSGRSGLSRRRSTADGRFSSTRCN
jgi:hypothetical protein